MSDELPEDQHASGVYLFQREKLPFRLSFERQAAAVQMGKRRANIVNSILFVYICFKTEDEIESALWSEQSKAKFLREMYEWFELKGGNIREENPVNREISELADRMWGDLEARNFKVDLKGAAPDPNAIG